MCDVDSGTPIVARDLHMSLQTMSLASGLANAGYAVGLDVSATLPDAAISSLAFSSVDLRKVAMHSDKEHVEVRQQAGEKFAPGWEFDDVLHDQVVARTGQGGQT